MIKSSKQRTKRNPIGVFYGGHASDFMESSESASAETSSFNDIWRQSVNVSRAQYSSPYSCTSSSSVSPSSPSTSHYTSTQPSSPITPNPDTIDCSVISLPAIHKLSLSSSTICSLSKPTKQTNKLKRSYATYFGPDLSHTKPKDEDTEWIKLVSDQESPSSLTISDSNRHTERWNKSETNSLIIENAVFIIQSIWFIEETISNTSIPLRIFLKEIIRRSRTSCNTLKLALFYIYKIRNSVKSFNRSMYCTDNLADTTHSGILRCGRKSILTALVIATKFYQDSYYSNKAWGEMSGLASTEIAAGERKMLQLLHYELNIQSNVWSNWTNFLQDNTNISDTLSSITGCDNTRIVDTPASVKDHCNSKDEDGRLIKHLRIGPSIKSSNGIAVPHPVTGSNFKRFSSSLPAISRLI